MIVVDTSVLIDHLGRQARRYRRSHHTFDLVDYVIAATARAHGAEVRTLNVRHLPMVADLRPPYEA